MPDSAPGTEGTAMHRSREETAGAQVLRWEGAPVVPGLVRRPQRLEERARERVDQIRVVKKDGKGSSCRVLYTL